MISHATANYVISVLRAEIEAMELRNPAARYGHFKRLLDSAASRIHVDAVLSTAPSLHPSMPPSAIEAARTLSNWMSENNVDQVMGLTRVEPTQLEAHYYSNL